MIQSPSDMPVARSGEVAPIHPQKSRRPRAVLRAALGVAAAIALSSCYTHSMSRNQPGYRGELTENQVVQSNSDGSVSETDIQRALRAGHQGTVRPPAGSRILLIQSGAPTPDPALATAMRKYYEVVPFNGMPPQETDAPIDFSRRMRLAAAQAGASHIVCVWGLIDVNTDALPTKTISWTPIVGQLIPDERRQSRIRLRAAVVETAGGSWSMIDGEPFGSQIFSGAMRRNYRTSWQQEALKSDAFPELSARLAGGGA